MFCLAPHETVSKISDVKECLVKTKILRKTSSQNYFRRKTLSNEFLKSFKKSTSSCVAIILRSSTSVKAIEYSGVSSCRVNYTCIQQNTACPHKTDQEFLPNTQKNESKTYSNVCPRQHLLFTEGPATELPILLSSKITKLSPN